MDDVEELEESDLDFLIDPSPRRAPRVQFAQHNPLQQSAQQQQITTHMAIMITIRTATTIPTIAPILIYESSLSIRLTCNDQKM